ncbi:MAG: helix-turn-helix domain-containing protein [bacterium]|nr:helix-turn-helix domain-containing protein [bacterium]
MRKILKPLTVATPRGALSRKDAAAYISVSTRQLDNYAAAGLLPRIKLGSKTVFRVVDLDAFLAGRLQSAEAAE